MQYFVDALESFDVGTAGWLLAILCAFLWGMSKSGIKGVATVAVPIMAFVFGSKASTGLIVPMLISADLLAVIYYRRHAKWVYLWRILPWTFLGIIIGVWIGDDMPEETFRDVMAILIFASLVMIFWWDRRTSHYVPDNWWFVGLMGIAAGFTTMIGNLAGAIVTIYLLTTRLPKNHFIGTGAWFFLFINVFKVPMHIFFWKTINTQTLLLNATLFPIIFIGFVVGVFLVGKMNERLYRRLVLIMTAIAALALLVR